MSARVSATGGTDAGKERLGARLAKSEFNASLAVHSKILCQIINHNTGGLKTLFGCPQVPEFSPQHDACQKRQYTSIIPALRRWMQGDQKLKVTVGYIRSLRAARGT